ncbi:MAG: cytidine deaminase [Alphaproteobacteria bacterium]
MSTVVFDTTLREKLIESAQGALVKSYAPYSKFRVGAAVLTEAGHIFTGANVENVSYGLTICAERAAIMNAVANEGPRMRLKATAVASAAQIPVSPCGACRQVIQEFGYDSQVIYRSYNGFIDVPLAELLPGPFDEIAATQENGDVSSIQVAR